MKNILAISLMIIVVWCSCSNESPTYSYLSGCEIENPVQKGDRKWGIDLLDLTESNSFEQNIALAKELRVEFISLHLPWNLIETSPNSYEDPMNALELLGKVATANNLKLSLTIRPIDLTGKTVPVDLDNTRFNSPMMINRFQSLIDYVFTKVEPSVLLNLQIGNEIDGYETSSEPSSFWEDYGTFLQEVSNYIHSIDSEIKVGFTGTHHGLLLHPEQFSTLLQNVDILGVTYYPIHNNFSVKDPKSVFTDLYDLIHVYNSKPIYLQEVGYQTSSKNNSNEEKQAEFYCNFFKAWDTYSDNIKSVNLVRLNDLSKQVAKDAAGPYGSTNSQFIEYIRTLGLRLFEDEGINKSAFEIVRKNIEARGW